MGKIRKALKTINSDSVFRKPYAISPERFYPQLAPITPEWLTTQLNKKPLKSCLSESESITERLTCYERWIEEVELHYGAEFALEIDMGMTVEEIAALGRSRREKLSRLKSS